MATKSHEEAREQAQTQCSDSEQIVIRRRCSRSEARHFAVWLVFCAFWAAWGPFLNSTRADTVALWLFDEQVGIDPSSVLNDAGPNSYFLILGRGATIGPGKFGNALRMIPPAPLTITYRGSVSDTNSGAGAVTFGLRPPPAKPGRTQPPLTWENAHFAAMFTNGDTHLRRAPFLNATDGKLNVGAGDWTIECWLQLDALAKEEGVLFEIGAGPRGENSLTTRFSVVPQENAFVFAGIAAENAGNVGAVAPRIEYANPEGPPGGRAVLHATTLALSTGTLPREIWFHVALVHSGVANELRLFLDGKVRAVAKTEVTGLPHGDEAYVSIGRDGRWQRPLSGAIDELRISDTAVYAADFMSPGSYSRLHGGARPVSTPIVGPPLLFSEVTVEPRAESPPLAGTLRGSSHPIDLGSRRHLFLDDALLAARPLQGKTVQLVGRMRGTSLYALQFVTP